MEEKKNVIVTLNVESNIKVDPKKSITFENIDEFIYEIIMNGNCAVIDLFIDGMKVD